MAIKNVVFDIGNVLVRWAPHEVIQSVFPEKDPVVFFREIRAIFLDLNRGKLTEKEALQEYERQFGIPMSQLEKLMQEFKLTQTPLPGSIELLKKLDSLDVPLYSITDNVKEFIEHHRIHSEFLPYFKGIVVSADLGILKPDPRIFEHLLNTYDLEPSESIFIDDLMVNVEGAQSVGMHAFQFIDAESCEDKLKECGVI